MAVRLWIYLINEIGMYSIIYSTWISPMKRHDAKNCFYSVYHTEMLYKTNFDRVPHHAMWKEIAFPLIFQGDFHTVQQSLSWKQRI